MDQYKKSTFTIYACGVCVRELKVIIDTRIPINLIIPKITLTSDEKSKETFVVSTKKNRYILGYIPNLSSLNEYNLILSVCD